MKRYLYIILPITILCIILVICFALKPHKEALYLELTEINKDSFSQNLVQTHDVPKDIPFYVEENKIIANDKKAKIFLVHKMSFEGTGRKGGFANYYSFKKPPARIKLDGFAPNKLNLGLNDPSAKLLDVRLAPKNITITKINVKKEEVTLQCDGKEFTLFKGKESNLSNSTKNINVTQEYLTPIPKDEEFKKENVKIEQGDFGEIEFTTTILVKNIGVYKIETNE